MAVYLARTIFQIYAFLWLLKKRRIRRIGDVVEVFYLDFLRLRRSDVEIVKQDMYEIVVRCRNPCPILSMARRLGLDTRYVCRVVSDPVSSYILRRLNPDLVFERNYSWIRPYTDSCEERVYIRSCRYIHRQSI